jgi:hypothetical protein
MTLSSELEFALLSLDSYNRGYNPGIPGLGDAPGTQVGNWTILDIDLPTGSEAAGFYAAAYQDASGNIVISYRGTDDPTIGADLNAWMGGAGFETAQARMAAQPA